MATKDDQGDDKRGVIDIVSLFEAEASRLLGAISVGRILHRTHNIRDSGHPFEDAFRSFLQHKLPPQFEVTHGYFYDVESRCTHQIDAAIVLSDEKYTLLTSADGASYVPFSSAIVIFEVKSSAAKMAEHLSQLMVRKAELDQMQIDMRSRGMTGGRPLDDVVTVLIVGDSSDIDVPALKKWFAENNEHPYYVLLLDRGVLIASRAWAEEFVEYDRPQPLGFYDGRNGRSPHVYRAKGEDRIKGRALLWLYFSMLAQVNLRIGNESHALYFTKDAVNTYALYSICALTELEPGLSQIPVRQESN